MALATHEIIISHPAHLFVGSAHALENQMVLLLQQFLCSAGGCTYCTTCRELYAHAHHQLMWLCPEGNYTRDAIQPILDTLTLACYDTKHFFIVIMHAERLQLSSANALLKSLEEPPFGYHFLLTTNQPHLIPATIRSRCIFHETIKNKALTVNNELVAHFSGCTYHNPASFLCVLDNINPSDQESYEYLDNIIQSLCAQFGNTMVSISGDTLSKLQMLINIYKEAALLPPQSGSSKIFWKNLYLKSNPYLISFTSSMAKNIA